MDAIEQAIRNAFAKGDPENPAFRDRVYRSASAALDRALQASPNLSADAAERRRGALLATISAIETEFVVAVDEAPTAAVAPAPSVAPAVAPDVVATEAGQSAAGRAAPEVVPSARSGRIEPTLAGTPRGEPTLDMRTERPLAGSAQTLRAEPRLGEADVADAPQASPPADDHRAPARQKPRRRSWGTLVGLLSFLIIVGLALWAASEFGLLRMRDAGQTQAPSATRPGNTAEPARPGDNDARDNWITVFSPADPTTVTATGGAVAEVVQSGDEQVLLVSSGPNGAPVRIDIGQGVLERIAGRRAVFDIVARGADATETQMSVTCDLAGLGECGRNRYQVGTQRAEYLFEVDVPAGAPGGAGHLAIVSDATNDARALEILEIRVSAQ